MKTSVDELMTFLNDNAINTEAKAIVAGLEPLLRRLAEIAESGRFPLAKEAGGERLKQIAGDVTLTGIRVSRCAVVSASRPFPKPGWMSEAAYRASLGANLRESLFCCLGFALAGDRERAERLARVVESYADGVMPLSFKRDEPNVLLVLVA